MIHTRMISAMRSGCPPVECSGLERRETGQFLKRNMAFIHGVESRPIQCFAASSSVFAHRRIVAALKPIRFPTETNWRATLLVCCFVQLLFGHVPQETGGVCRKWHLQASGVWNSTWQNCQNHKANISLHLKQIEKRVAFWESFFLFM